MLPPVFRLTQTNSRRQAQCVRIATALSVIGLVIISATSLVSLVSAQG